MEIRFDCDCYNRTLVIEIPKRYAHLKEEMLKYLEQYYDEWVCFETEETEVMCLEEYMTDKFSDQYELSFMWYVEEDKYENNYYR